MVDIRQSLQYADFLKLEGWTTERIDGINYFIRKLPLVGSVLKLQRPEKINFDTIDKLCRKYHIFRVILEPNLSTVSVATPNSHVSLLHHGYKLSKSTYLPSRTLHLDLTLPVNQLIGKVKKDARRAIRVGNTNTIKKYSTPNGIRKWREVWKASVKFDRYVPSFKALFNLRKSFPDNYSVFLASHNIFGNIMGGALFTRTSHGVAYYWYGFTNSEGRTSLSQYSLLYQGILWAKKNGCKVFDFEGIYDPRFPNKSWLGFTHFKRSFGGYEVSYPGCYTKFRFPL